MSRRTAPCGSGANGGSGVRLCNATLVVCQAGTNKLFFAPNGSGGSGVATRRRRSAQRRLVHLVALYSVVRDENGAVQPFLVRRLPAKRRPKSVARKASFRAQGNSVDGWREEWGGCAGWRRPTVCTLRLSPRLRQSPSRIVVRLASVRVSGRVGVGGRVEDSRVAPQNMYTPAAPAEPPGNSQVRLGWV